MRPHLIGAAATLVFGLVIVGMVFASGESVREYIRDKCRATGVARDPNGHRASRYDCPGRPSAMAAKLRSAHKPADQRASAAGYFLRYSNDMVGITPGSRRGRSTVYLADERNGYGYFHPYVGGWWGTYSGPAETFRGGGPSTGK